ncbi:hypothetical protein LJC23_05240 [Desulfovibrio sp. OttesenSCG-928-I05]|nr:hypothetical protein [Desulfovibrio sp. OttesenSCG-928-I05]
MNSITNHPVLITGIIAALISLLLNLYSFKSTRAYIKARMEAQKSGGPLPPPEPKMKFYYIGTGFSLIAVACLGYMALNGWPS